MRNKLHENQLSISMGLSNRLFFQNIFKIYEVTEYESVGMCDKTWSSLTLVNITREDNLNSQVLNLIQNEQINLAEK